MIESFVVFHNGTIIFQVVTSTKCLYFSNWRVLTRQEIGTSSARFSAKGPGDINKQTDPHILHIKALVTD